MRPGQVLLLVGVIGSLGFFLLLRAAPLAKRYNGWTSKLRAKNIGLPAPPTESMRALNIRIMTIIFRVFGLLLMLPAILVCVAVVHAMIAPL